jgi:hypothetical protein
MEDSGELAEQLFQEDTEGSKADCTLPFRMLTVNSVQEAIRINND